MYSHQLQKWQDSDKFKNNFLFNISNILPIFSPTGLMYLALIRSRSPTIHIQWSLTYTSRTYLDYSHIRTHYWMFGNQSSLYIGKVWLTYPDIQLSGQSAWERRCPDKYVPSVITLLLFLFCTPGHTSHHSLISRIPPIVRLGIQ